MSKQTKGGSEDRQQPVKATPVKLAGNQQVPKATPVAKPTAQAPQAEEKKK